MFLDLKKSCSLRGMSKWQSSYGIKVLALCMLACPELPQRSFFKWLPGRSQHKPVERRFQETRKGECLRSPTIPPHWPAPSDLELDQRTDDRTGWCVCVCVCERYISKWDLHSPGGETTHTHTGTHLVIHPYPPIFIRANVKMWNWALHPQVAWKVEMGVRWERCEEALRNPLRGSENRRWWCAEWLLAVVLHGASQGAHPQGWGSRRQGVKVGRNCGHKTPSIPHWFHCWGWV